ncbi:MAG: AhpC/TSA family protein [Cyclobacteriaceae bacterium]
MKIRITLRLALPALFLFLIHSAYGQIATSSDKTCPVKLGETIPNASVLDVNSKTMDISEAIGSKPSIIIFYRGGWCPYCNVHLAALQEYEKELIKMGYQIIAVTPDSPDNIKKTLNEKELTYTILSDNKYELMSKMGLGYVDRKNRTLPIPSVYIVDADGKVKFNYINPNFRVRIEPELLMKAAELAIK